MPLEIAGKKYDIVTVDFETFYDKGYTLSGRINTSEYIRDERFHAHGVGIKINDGKALWFTGRNIGLALREINWKKSALLCHNTPFDGFILTEVYGCIPAFYLDTLAMARACHGHHMRHDLDTIARAHGFPGKTKRSALGDTKGKQLLTREEERALGAYCVDDVNDTYGIFHAMYPNIPDDELELINLTTQMFCEPVLHVDLPRVQAELEKEVGGKVGALLKSGAQPEDLLSNPKFAELLKQNGARVPMKLSPTTGRLVPAFAKSDLEFQKLVNSSNPKIAALAQARLKFKSTIGETRAVRFLEAGKDGMKLPVLLNYCGAHTTRWSGGNKMNLQNLVRGGELRKSILAPPGYVVVVADSAQIEARVLAWLAQQDNVVEAFANKRDLYSEFATELFGYHVDRKHKDANGVSPHAMEGFVGKVCVLGLGYGMGHAKLRATLESGSMGMKVLLSEGQCRKAVDIYRAKNYQIKNLWKKMDSIIGHMVSGATGDFAPISYGKGFVQLPNGLFLQYYGLHGELSARYDELVVSEATYLTRAGRSKIYGGLLTENVVQALARCIIGEQLLEISRKYRVVTTTHDEIVVIAKKADAQKCLDFMLKVMSTPPDWAPGLPLAAEGGYDTSYSK